MRIPVKRIWRAFKELDSYSDDECRQFARLARRRAPWRWLHAALVLITFFGGVAVLGIGLSIAVAMLTSSQSFPRWVEMLFASGVMILTIGAPSMAALLVRDFFLRRRLLYVLRDRGSCAQCGYSLVGLVIPESLKVSCPECGLISTVDAALSALTRDEHGQSVTGERRVVMERQPRWTPERRRRWKRNAIATLALLLLTIGAPLVLYEFTIRLQAAQARREMPTAADVSALLERRRPDVERVAHPKAHAIILANAARIAEIEERIWPPSERETEMGWFGYEVVLMPEAARSPTKDSDEFEMEEKARDLALRSLAELERESVFDAIAAIRHAPVQITDRQLAPEAFVNVTLPHLSGARAQARLMGARMRLAIERGDTAQAAESLETLQWIARACGEQPMLVEVLVGMAIQTHAENTLERWLASNPSVEELDAIEASWRATDFTPSAALAIETEELAVRGMVASLLSDADVIRFAPISGLTAPWLGQQVLASPGRWSTNRDAISQLSAAALARLPLEPYELNVAANLPPQPTFQGAGLAKIVAPSLDRMIDACHSARVGSRVIPTLIALERWRIAHGSYPDTLDALVPTLLPSVPIDPWSGKPLGYRRVDSAADPLGRSFFLYSLGSDGIDNGGVTTRKSDPRPVHFDPAHTPPGFDGDLNRAAPIPRSVR